MTINKNQSMLLAAIVFVLVLFLGLQSISGADEWVCQNGRWMAKGNPTDPQPVFDCKMVKSKNIAYDVYCEKDNDCACGGHISKNTCFIGNKRYIDPIKQCKNLCKDGLKMQCVKNQCKQSK